MTYSSIHDYFDNTDLEVVDTDNDYLERLELAQDALDEVTNADIEEFDVHDAIDTLSIHFDVEKSDLLDHYDR